jgi:tripartite-type tricarboxylate transporter receptor subunit TctC
MKTRKMFIVLVTVLMLVVSGCASSKGTDAGAKKSDFPKKSVDLTILFAAGTSADLGIRQLVDIMQKDFGQPIVCNNRTGGGGAVGYQYVLGQPAAGYNIVWNSTSISTCYYQGNLPVDQSYKSFRGIAVKKDTPDDIVKILEQAFINAAKSEKFQTYAKNNGVLVNIMGSADFDQYIADNDKQMAELMQKIGLKKQ